MRKGWSVISGWIERKRWLLVLSLAVIAVGLSLFLPALVLNPNGVSATEELAAENALRTTLLQAIGGSVLLVGLYVTWRTFDLNRQGHELDRQGQVTERFTRAIDQLGNKESMEVRLGGIYALERIARDSRDDSGPVMEVLTAYIREHAPWRRPDPTKLESPTPLLPHVSASTEARSTPGDIQGALAVLGRRNAADDPPGTSLDLSAANLQEADLRGAELGGASLLMSNLQGAMLWEANLKAAVLREAVLTKADLRRAVLIKANLVGAYLQAAFLPEATLHTADLRGAKLQGAVLVEANLQQVHLGGANLYRAHLQGADLREAVLREAVLREADLREADLRGATLHGADLRGANLRGADVRGANLYRAHLQGADLQGADLREGGPPEGGVRCGDDMA